MSKVFLQWLYLEILSLIFLEMHAFEDLWQKNYPEIPPVGFRFREKLSDRWIRFHSLPKSKRYPTNEEERSIILDRANILAGEIFRAEKTFWLVSSEAECDPELVSFELDPYTRKNRELTKAFSWQDLEEPIEDRLQWSTYAKALKWRPSSFDDVFLKIADDEECDIVFASQDLSSLLAPYDGGFDLILSTSFEVETLKKKFSAWLSTRDDFL